MFAEKSVIFDFAEKLSDKLPNTKDENILCPSNPSIYQTPFENKNFSHSIEVYENILKIYKYKGTGVDELIVL